MKLRSIVFAASISAGFLTGCTKTDLGTPNNPNPTPTPTCTNEEVVCNESLYLFVDATNGNDTADGSLKYPLKTIGHAIELAQSGTKKSIAIATGNYL